MKRKTQFSDTKKTENKVWSMCLFFGGWTETLFNIIRHSSLILHTISLIIWKIAMAFCDFTAKLLIMSQEALSLRQRAINFSQDELLLCCVVLRTIESYLINNIWEVHWYDCACSYSLMKLCCLAWHEKRIRKGCAWHFLHATTSKENKDDVRKMKMKNKSSWHR